MFAAIDDVLSVDASKAALTQGKASLALWLLAGAAGVFSLALLLGIFLSWRRNRQRFSDASKSSGGPVTSSLKRFLRWLFYPSFQHLFNDD